MGVNTMNKAIERAREEYANLRKAAGVGNCTGTADIAGLMKYSYEQALEEQREEAKVLVREMRDGLEDHLDIGENAIDVLIERAKKFEGVE